ncbi:MAG: DoxX family protein [Deltaproteobacteria bacterium]|nr:MAG: DoxX family protein [Deltaproteobacteria bacterium]
MNTRTLGYWASTGLFSLALGGSAAVYLTQQPFMVDAVNGHLGYPVYFLTILGLAKALGVLALLTPAFPKLKEWAYAGFTFNLLGATWSHLAVGDALGESVAPLVLLAVLGASYALRPEHLKLQASVAAPKAVVPQGSPRLAA